MKVVYLVRHAQGSFGSEDYDRLSDKGWAQAKLLGAALRQRIPQVHVVATGTLRRHQETAQACLPELGEAVSAELSVRALASFDEFDHGQLLARLEPRYGDQQQLALDVMSAEEPRRAFQEIFARAMARWTCGEHDSDYTEPWLSFRQRSWRGLQDVLALLGPTDTALVFTSGGPITAVCQELLGTPDGAAVQLSKGLVNCGVTKVLQKGSGLFLSTMNEHAHFEGVHRPFITYR